MRAYRCVLTGTLVTQSACTTPTLNPLARSSPLPLHPLTQPKHIHRILPRPNTHQRNQLSPSRITPTENHRGWSNSRFTNDLDGQVLDLRDHPRHPRNGARLIPPFDHMAHLEFLAAETFWQGRAVAEVGRAGVAGAYFALLGFMLVSAS